MKPDDLIGHDVYDPEGELIGRVGAVYLDGVTRQPQWVTVRTGHIGHRESFVPLRDARSDPDGLRVGVRLSVVKDAPQVEVPQGNGALSEEAAVELSRYYGLPDAPPPVPLQRGPKPSDMPRKRVH